MEKLTVRTTGKYTEATGSCSSIYREPHLNLQDRDSRTFTWPDVQEIHHLHTKPDPARSMCSPPTCICGPRPADLLISVSLYCLEKHANVLCIRVFLHLASLFVGAVDNSCTMLSGDGKNVRWMSVGSVVSMYQWQARVFTCVHLTLDTIKNKMDLEKTATPSCAHARIWLFDTPNNRLCSLGLTWWTCSGSFRWTK